MVCAIPMLFWLLVPIAAADPLHDAARAGDTERVLQAISSGTDVDAKDSDYGRTLLYWAAREGHRMLSRRQR